MTNTMIYRGYRASLTFDPDDRILVGRVLDIDDIIAFHGESVSEFEQAFHDAVDSYLEACEQLDQEPNQSASGQLLLRIPPKVHSAVLAAAKQSGQSLNNWVAQILKEAVHSHTGHQ
ncbi:Predicted nuclease of the RNAse H fold, HicB family [Allochromatium warmingii]|uniref:Predicted nuclease of the RNAse H fold, HicB family n=1 Tax=Allochromatium warmingii TaxID=61595 RepID=A0A1H3IN54_ALLWA|nr:type II toxin-antitoxin system HicB family antitoxin [Allochromatium warmingii]SDY28508.1 Predicted nuclease of the RNAse H fold, HicB family [Allochromatium warmingii]